MTKLLAAHKKTLNIRLLKAIRNKNNSEAKSMLKHSTCNSVVCKYGTLLHWAASHGNATITKHLIDLGWNVNTLHDDLTPLILAIRARSLATIKILLRANAKIDRVGTRQYTILETVFFYGNVNPGVVRVFVRYLRRRTSTPEEFAKKLVDARFSLYHAVHIGGLDLVKMLIAVGLRINNMRGYGMKSALHAAVELGNVAFVEWLLNQNADVNLLDDRGFTPLYYVYKRGLQVHEEITRLAILKLMMDRDSDLMKPNPFNGYPQVTSIIRYGTKDAISLLMKSGVDFNAKIERDDKSLLHLLAMNDSPGIKELFKDVHLDVNALDQRGVCPLYVAAKRGNTTMVKFLLERGADPNVSWRYNPLVATFAEERTGFWKDPVDECAYLLLRGGADPQMRKIVIDDIFAAEENCEFHSDKTRMVVAQLALMESLGTSITKYTRFVIGTVPKLMMYFHSCRKVLKAKIFGSFTLLDSLKITDDEMKKHLRDETFVDKMRRVNCKYELRMNFSYYYEILKRQIVKVGFAMRLEYQAIAALGRIFDGYMPDVVVRLIVAYLDKRNRRQLCRSVVNRLYVKVL